MYIFYKERYNIIVKVGMITSNLIYTCFTDNDVLQGLVCFFINKDCQNMYTQISVWNLSSIHLISLIMPVWQWPNHSQYCPIILTGPNPNQVSATHSNAIQLSGSLGRLVPPEGFMGGSSQHGSYNPPKWPSNQALSYSKEKA